MTMLTREKVIQSMAELPTEFSIEDLIERLVLLAKIESGLRQVEAGQVLSHEEVKRRVAAWRN